MGMVKHITESEGEENESTVGNGKNQKLEYKYN